jgi:C1A family cysteine protease
MVQRKKYHWRRDAPDSRDHVYKISTKVSIPDLIDLRPYDTAIEDQGNLGSCTGCAIAAAYEIVLKKTRTPIDVSKLFIYYQERLLEGTVNYDSGSTIRTGIKSVYKFGAPLENLWPYVIANYTTQPSTAAYSDALNRRVTEYQRCAGFAEVRNSLASGYPVVIGFDVYSSFETNRVAKTGVMPYPNTRREQYLGGHAVTIVGYRNKDNRFICKNSWGPSWGDKGYFYMPYKVIQNPGMSGDFWVIKSIM